MGLEMQALILSRQCESVLLIQDSDSVINKCLLGQERAGQLWVIVSPLCREAGGLQQLAYHSQVISDTGTREHRHTHQVSNKCASFTLKLGFKCWVTSEVIMKQENDYKRWSSFIRMIVFLTNFYHNTKAQSKKSPQTDFKLMFNE